MGEDKIVTIFNISGVKNDIIVSSLNGFDSGDMAGVITDREGLISASKFTKAIGGGLNQQVLQILKVVR